MREAEAVTEAGGAAIPKVWPERGWREVWHEDCPERGMMRRLNEYRTIEDGSRLRLFECVGCGARCYAGVDAGRRIVSVSGEPAIPPCVQERPP